MAGPLALIWVIEHSLDLVNEGIKEHPIELIAMGCTKHLFSAVIRAFSGQNIFSMKELRRPLNICREGIGRL